MEQRLKYYRANCYYRHYTRLIENEEGGIPLVADFRHRVSRFPFRLQRVPLKLMIETNRVVFSIEFPP